MRKHTGALEGIEIAEWLASIDPTTFVGRARAPAWCPLAQYFEKHCGFRAVEVSAGRMWWLIGKNCWSSRNLTPHEQRFVLAVDEYVGAISAEKALEILKRTEGEGE